MIKNKIILFILLITCTTTLRSASILIPMDLEQKNHLKAYGVAYWTLEQGMNVRWLLNYRGGSFLLE
ncbi:MAG: asparagine synthetase B, partial [bacterium]